MANTAFYIYPHLGMGDQFICNGMIREIINRNPEANYVLFSHDYYVDSVSQMYSDLLNVKILGGNTSLFSQICRRYRANIILIGHIPWRYPDKNLEYNFYAQHGVPIHKKWNSFKCPRNEKAEQELYDSFNINEEYIFVHDDGRFSIDNARLPKNIKILRPIPGQCKAMTHYAKIVENAKEVHCIESSFAFMNELMNLNSNFIVHRYARRLNLPLDVPEYRHVKEILV